MAAVMRSNRPRTLRMARRWRPVADLIATRSGRTKRLNDRGADTLAEELGYASSYVRATAFKDTALDSTVVWVIERLARFWLSPGEQALFGIYH